MKRLLILSVCCVLMTDAAWAQDFITRGKIEFEIKRNNKKLFSERQPGMENYLDALPEFDINYRDLVFSESQLLYSTARRGNSMGLGNDNSVYTNLDARKTISKQTYLNEAYIVEDSIRPIKWKIENEIRKIAGFECRKAVGRFHDSMYVVAFYCPEIVPQGGPEFFAGLPGMILGLAIPRLYTTWFATRIELASVDEAKITAPTLKKGSQLYKKKELSDILYNKYKDLGWWNDLTPEKMYNTLDAYTF